jgi:hypothetical protein
MTAEDAAMETQAFREFLALPADVVHALACACPPGQVTLYAQQHTDVLGWSRVSRRVAWLIAMPQPRGGT